jgi:hypothetical protein
MAPECSVVGRRCFEASYILLHGTSCSVGDSARAVNTHYIISELSVSHIRCLTIADTWAVREGVYIYQRGTNPYYGGIFHHVR